VDDVLITGATGFVGRRLTHRLLADDYKVRVLARSPERAEELATRGAEIVEGDITELESLERAVDGVDGVFHLAASYRLGGDLERMRQVNVEGTRNVLDAALEAGVSRIVYCGSDTSLGHTRGEVADEGARHDGEFRSNYARTKHEAHKVVEEYVEQGAPVVNAIVSSVYGPGDESPIAELIEHHLAGRAIAHLDRDAGYTFTHVDDVAAGLKLAHERGELGERYLISGEPATFEEFFDLLSDQTGIPAPRFELPDWLVDTLGPVLARVAPLVGKSGAEIREMLDMGRDVTRFFSGDKAREELGWQPRSLEEGLANTLPAFADRELEAATDLLHAARLPLAALALFDIGLGVTATVFPGLYVDLIHPYFDQMHPEGPTYLVRRTGVLWLVFAGVQGFAALDPVERPGWVLVAGALRLMDVPADLVYAISADDLGWLGQAGLLSAPVANLATGTFFAYVGYRGLRAGTREASIADQD
jgi:nucleoside-diphosphate-sugar epimerase